MSHRSIVQAKIIIIIKWEEELFKRERRHQKRRDLVCFLDFSQFPTRLLDKIYMIFFCEKSLFSCCCLSLPLPTILCKEISHEEYQIMTAKVLFACCLTSEANSRLEFPGGVPSAASCPFLFLRKAYLFIH